MFDLHVPAEVPLQVKLTGAVRTLEGLVTSMEMHVAQQVVHSVEGLATHLGRKKKKKKKDKYTDEHRRGPAEHQRALSQTCESCLLRPLHLAFEGLHRQVDDHVRLERLLLDEALEADVTLEGPDAVVDQHVPLQVGGERELP